jgi:hypothetical protein
MARAYSLNTLIARLCEAARPVDYMKMDIEGAERDVLRCNTEWAARVRSVKIELHGDYSKRDCIRDLEQLGFKAWADNHHASCAVGIREL